jgi:hypothetical protein
MSRILPLRLQRWMPLLVVAVLLLASLACSGLDSTATLVVINNTGQDLCVVNAVAAGEGSAGNWGDNRLAEPPLPNGQQVEVELENGTYDLYAETCDGSFAERYGEELEGSVEWTLTPD